MIKRLNGLTARKFYALIWKDFVVHKRHYIWTLLEITIPVLVCAMAILSNSHQGKPKLENERTFDADDYERIYGDLNSQRHRLLVAPNTSFTRALVDQIDDGAVSVELCNTEDELVRLIKMEIPVSLDQVKRLLPDDSANVTIGGVVINTDDEIVKQQQQQQQRSNSTFKRHHQTKNPLFYDVISKLDGKPMRIPVHFDMSIRAKDFRLGPEPFPKKNSLGPFIHSDHYTATFFMASQIMLSRAYINLLANYLKVPLSSSSSSSSSQTTTISPTTTNDTSRFTNNPTAIPFVIPTNDDIIGQRIPYPKYVAHKRLKETTLGTFVAGSQKQKPFVLTMDYCITVGFLVTAIFLAKRIVDEKKSKVRDMLRLVGISDWTYYGSHMCNTMLIMLIQCALITLLFTGHSDAPAQNISSTLMFAILIIYSFSAIMFVLFLSTLFNSSTKAIIFTSLLWLGLPEILDRIFKMDSGVIESNGFLAVDENLHLMFCLLPNFGLRLMNRLLTECDIYGEFYAKKQLYGEYRAIWSNITTLLPLYKSITVCNIMLAMVLSAPIFASLIYLVNLSVSSGQGGGLANFGQSEGSEKESNKGAGLIRLIRWLLKFIIALIGAPFKLAYLLFSGNSYSNNANSSRDRSSHNRSAINLNQSTPNVVFIDGNKPPIVGANGAYLNTAYTNTANSMVDLGMIANQNGDNKKHRQLVNMELNHYPSKNNLDYTKEQPQIFQVAQQQLQQQQLTNLPASCTDVDADNDPKYFETAPKMLETGVSIRNLCKTYFTSSPKASRIDAVRNVSLDMFYSQILGKFSAFIFNLLETNSLSLSTGSWVSSCAIGRPTESDFDLLFELISNSHKGELILMLGLISGRLDVYERERERERKSINFYKFGFNEPAISQLKPANQVVQSSYCG